MIRIFLRMDDFSAISDTTLEKQLIHILEKSGVSCLFGVVPFICENEFDPTPQIPNPLPIQKATILVDCIKKGYVEVAQHGVYHQTIINPKLSQATEFSGLNYQEQFEKIKLGKNFLEDLLEQPINIFIPPWNDYDLNTLHSIEALGFTVISTGVRFGSITRSSSLRYLPITCNISKISNVINAFRNHKDDKAIVGILFHPYDFIESNDPRGWMDFSYFCETIKWMKLQSDIEFYRVSDLVLEDGSLYYERYRENYKNRKIKKFTPPFIRRIQNSSVYYSTRLAARIHRVNLTALLSFYIMLIALSTLFAVSIFKYLQSFIYSYLAVFLLLLGTISALIIQKHRGYRTLILISVSLGLMLGTIIVHFL